MKKKLPHLLATFTTTQALPLYTPRSTLGDHDQRSNSKVVRPSIYKDNGTHLLAIDVLDGEVVETRWGGGADREQPQGWPGNHEEVLVRLANKVNNINMRMTIA